MPSTAARCGARAFDVARYLLPTSTYTGLGYLASARTMERQIVRLLSHPLAELREIGDALKHAATTQPAFNPQAARLRDLVAGLERDAAWDRKGELAAALRESAADRRARRPVAGEVHGAQRLPGRGPTPSWPRPRQVAAARPTARTRPAA